MADVTKTKKRKNIQDQGHVVYDDSVISLKKKKSDNENTINLKRGQTELSKDFSTSAKLNLQNIDFTQNQNWTNTW